MMLRALAWQSLSGIGSPVTAPAFHRPRVAVDIEAPLSQRDIENSSRCVGDGFLGTRQAQKARRVMRGVSLDLESAVGMRDQC